MEEQINQAAKTSPETPKKPNYALRSITMTLITVLALAIGFFLLLMSIFAHPAEQWAIFTIAPTVYVLLMLIASGQARKKWFRYVAALGLAIIAVFGAILGLYYAQQSIPTVSDRGLQIRSWHPFEEDTSAVLLNEESTLKLTYDEAASLRIDGATALYPVYASFARNVFEPSDEYYTWGEDKAYSLDCTGTNNAFTDLIHGVADVIFCAAPSAKQVQEAADAGKEFHLTPIGRECFVFFVNSRNQVKGLTVPQIQQIYTGEITNWQELGGKKQAIRAYQRNEGSGSQTAMQMVMAGLPLMDAPREDVVADMGGIVSRVADYRNYDGAIGYTFRFYANEMVANDRIRLLELNGIAPTAENIVNGSYPICDDFYAITVSPIGEAAPEESNPTLKAFLDWCTGEQGQQVVEQVGYVRAN